jgi:alkylation response protein AidB-like acyl-CoA dehydrogenase
VVSGFSEPGAGSGLQTSAVREGTDFVVNGQKVWTSQGTRATHMELLVRTDPNAPKHKGISALLVDMTTPAIDVRPFGSSTELRSSPRSSSPMCACR